MTFKSIPRREKIRWLRFIDNYVRKQGWPPTVREIQKHFSISSTSVVDYRLHRLINDGYVHREPGITRGLRITQDGYIFMGNKYE